MQLNISGPEDRVSKLLRHLPTEIPVSVEPYLDEVILHVDLDDYTLAKTTEEHTADWMQDLEPEAEPAQEPEPEEEEDPEPEPVEVPTGTLSNNIVRHLKAHGPATTVDIAEACGAESGDTLKMLRRLRELGKVESAGRSGWKVTARKAFDHDAARRRAGQGF